MTPNSDHLIFIIRLEVTVLSSVQVPGRIFSTRRQGQARIKTDGGDGCDRRWPVRRTADSIAQLNADHFADVFSFLLVTPNARSALKVDPGRDRGSDRNRNIFESSVLFGLQFSLWPEIDTWKYLMCCGRGRPHRPWTIWINVSHVKVPRKMAVARVFCFSFSFLNRNLLGKDAGQGKEIQVKYHRCSFNGCSRVLSLHYHNRFNSSVSPAHWWKWKTWRESRGRSIQNGTLFSWRSAAACVVCCTWERAGGASCPSAEPVGPTGHYPLFPLPRCNQSRRLFLWI